MAETKSKKEVKASDEKQSKKSIFPDVVPTIILCGGNKGGVGKSFFARALYDLMLSESVPVVGVEADINSPDFSGVATEDVEVIEFSDDPDKIDDPNLLLEILTQDKKHAVVNLGAACHEALNAWINMYSIPDLLERHNCKIVMYFVTSGEYDSLKSLQKSLNDLGDKIPHIVVKNLKYSDWQYYEEDTETQALIKKHNCMEIELPKIPTRLSSFILRKRLSFTEATSYRGDRKNGDIYTIADQSCIFGFKRQFAAQVIPTVEKL